MSNNDSLKRDTTRLIPNFTAGFNLLARFQNQWEQVHSKSEQNVIKAKRVFETLNSIERGSVGRIEALNDFITSYRSLGKLEEQIKTINDDFAALMTNLAKTEELLIVLKENKEAREANQFLEDLRADYHQQAQQMRDDSKLRLEKLGSEHLLRVAKFEMEQEKVLEERRQILERAFKEEKENYLGKFNK